MSPRPQNEKKFGQWDELPGGGRRYRLDVPGKLGWLARYLKDVDANEATVRFWREIYDDTGKPVETHEKFPVDKGHQKGQDAAMTITKQTVADKLAAYLHHEITLAQLVDWSERALMDGEVAERDAKTLSSVIARLGVADVRAFGLAWEDCEELLRKLGFSPRVEVVAA
jgi:hypothetical protein